MKTINFLGGAGHIGNGQASRFSLRMRAAATVTLLSVGGLAVVTPYARAEQVKRYVAEHQPRKVNEFKAGQTDKLTPAQWKAVDAQRAKEAAEKEAKKPLVRLLSAKEMQAEWGSGPYRNKYFAGTLPWHRSLRDVNLCNGNLFKSFTDMQVAPAKGAGLALQRTYNSQEERVGPFGVGWTHAYDIRMEDENPTTGQTDDDSLNYSDRSDFFAGKHKYHRDCDGLYTPPPYLFDETSSDYQTFLVNGPIVSLADTETGMDGTTKHFTRVADNWRACDSITDRYGNVTSLSYGVTVGGTSVAYLLNTVTDPSGRTLTFSWTNLGTTSAPLYRISQVDGPQYSVAYGYNGDANLSSVTLDYGAAMSGHLNRTTSYTYASVTGTRGTEAGLLASITDPLGHSVYYTYRITDIDQNNNVISTPTGTAWVASVQEPAGVDANNVARTQTWTLHENSAFSTSGQVVGVETDAYLRKLNLLLKPSRYGPVTNLHKSVYDSANNVTSVVNKYPLTASSGSDGPNRADNFTYGPHGNVLTHSVGSFTGTETTTYYDAAQYFQKKSVTDMNGNVTRFGIGTKSDTTVGNRGSVLWVKDAKYGDGTFNNTGTRFQYAYNSNGQKTSETNQAGTVTNYTYGDTYGNLTSVVQDPGTGHLARTTSMTYDVGGHVLTSTDPNGRQSTFSYNVLGQPTSAAFPATMNGNVQVTPSETVSYSYGDNGRTESVTDNRGTTTLSYESGSERLHSVADPVTGTTTYKYGLAGERTSMVLPGGDTWTYSFASTWNTPATWMLPKDDPNSVAWQLQSMTDDAGRRIDYYVSSASRIGWDEVGNYQGCRTNQTFSGTTLQSYVETDCYYDGYTPGVGGVGQAAGQFASHRWLKHLENRFHDVSASTNTLLVKNDYAYDAVGQRSSNAIGSLSSGSAVTRTESYGYDELNRLTSVNYGDGETQTYSFDNMGNRTGKSDTVSSTTTSESYVVNAANMLTSRTVGSTTSSYTNDANGNTLTGGGRTNTWDSQNRLVQCVNGSTTSSFVYGADGIRRRSTVGSTTTDFVVDANMFVREKQGSTVTATYFMGANGPAYRRNDVTGAVRWYLYDGLGSVLGEVDPSGSITGTRKHDVYGLTRSSTGTITSKHGFVGGLGHPSEDETGLIYMRARYMDPTTGRFGSEDPAMHGINWFIYCNDNPINLIDASGREFSLVGSLVNCAISTTLFGITGFAYSLFQQMFINKNGAVNWSTVWKDTAAAAFMGFLSGGGLGVACFIKSASAAEILGGLACIVSAKNFGEACIYAFLLGEVGGIGRGLLDLDAHMTQTGLMILSLEYE